MPQRTLFIINKDHTIVKLSDRPWYLVPNQGLGVVYRGLVHRVYEVGASAVILFCGPTYPKSECQLVDKLRLTPTQTESLHKMIKSFWERDSDSLEDPQEEAPAGSGAERGVLPNSGVRHEESLPSVETYDMHQLRNVWQNCLQILIDSGKSDRHARARTIMKLVEAEWDRRGRFSWPSTDSQYQGVAHSQPYFDYAEGMLSYLGYHVGTSGASERMRRAILDQAFVATLPWLNDQEYMSSWGPPSSPVRLKKMAYSIAAFCKVRKNSKQKGLETAIRHWESDLHYLYEKYYKGRFGFSWPSTFS